MDAITKAKKAAGEKAASFIENGMAIGLGTGSTAYWATLKIGAMVREGLQVRAIPTSRATEQLALEQQIPLATFADIAQLDVDIDGADEVSESLQLIKGGGASLLREKIVALASRRRIIAVDEHKYVKTLGRFPLPVEVVPFGWQLLLAAIRQLGAEPVLRRKEGEIVVTDNGNYIIDCAFGAIPDPVALHRQLKAITGVVETGLFTDMQPAVIIGYENGEVKVLP